MKNKFGLLMLCFCGVSVLTLAACRPAAYEIIKDGKDRSGDKTGNPVNIDNPDDRQDPNANPPPTSTDQNWLPTARVEVIDGGRSVTKVRVNTPVTIQPSYDTLDPDDVGRSLCRNPGIVWTEYDLQNLTSLTKERAGDCASLAVPYTFTTLGKIEIIMEVKSNENETAFASMILEVIDSNSPATGSGGFTISATPMVAKTKQPVDFAGICETSTENTISWNFGDEGKATGTVTSHAYSKTGQYPVNAVCTDQDGNQLKAKLTIVVTTDGLQIPGRATPGTPDPTDPNGGRIPDGSNPGSGDPNSGNPGQGQPGQGQPGQGQPGQG